MQESWRPTDRQDRRSHYSRRPAFWARKSGIIQSGTNTVYVYRLSHPFAPFFIWRHLLGHVARPPVHHPWMKKGRRKGSELFFPGKLRENSNKSVLLNTFDAEIYICGSRTEGSNGAIVALFSPAVITNFPFSTPLWSGDDDGEEIERESRKDVGQVGTCLLWARGWLWNSDAFVQSYRSIDDTHILSFFCFLEYITKSLTSNFLIITYIHLSVVWPRGAVRPWTPGVMILFWEPKVGKLHWESVCVFLQYLLPPLE